MSRRCSTREVGNACRNLVGKTDVTRPPAKPSYRGEDMDVKTYIYIYIYIYIISHNIIGTTWCSVMDWNHLWHRKIEGGFLWREINCRLKTESSAINILSPLNAKLNPICHLLALLGAHHILHVSRIRVKCFNSIFAVYLPTNLLYVTHS